jgi:hypothetical protein
MPGTTVTLFDIPEDTVVLPEETASLPLSPNNILSIPDPTIKLTRERLITPKGKVFVPRYRAFSLGDFKEFDRCPFSFFVKHHLQKKYELEEGTANQALGSMLDLTIKKIHKEHLYHSSEDELVEIIRTSAIHIKDKAAKDGPFSYFGPQSPFINEELINKTQEIFRSYLQKTKNIWQESVTDKTFWEYDVIGTDGEMIRLWGGPDIIELGKDGLPEVVDFKYFENQEKGRNYLDMEQMPKMYTLLTSEDLKKSGYTKSRFKIRFWQDPLDEDWYEEFELSDCENIAAFFKQKAENILRLTELSLCEKAYCKVCQHGLREEWLLEWNKKSWLS